MRFSYILRILVLTIVVCTLAVTAQAVAPAAVVLHHSSFDTDISDWTSGPGVHVEWSSVDVDGDPGSGSLRGFDLKPNSSNSISTCFAIPIGGGPVVWGARNYSPDGNQTALAGSLRFYSGSDCTGMQENASLVTDFGRYGKSTWSETQATAQAPAWAQSARLLVGLGSPGGDGVHVDEIYALLGFSCRNTERYMCLNGGRFRASASWEIADGTRGDGGTVKLTEDSGYLWFFDENNIEMVVKVLDGCGLSGSYWVFASGLTNVQVDLRVTDTSTGAKWQHVNPLNHAFAPVQDTGAFAACF